MTMNPYSGLDQAQYTEQGIFLPPHFAGEIEICRVQAKRTQMKGDATIFDFRILSSNMPEHPVGEVRNFYQDMRNLPVAFGQIKALLIGLSGRRFDQADPAFVQRLPDIMAAAVDQRNILMGFRCMLRTDAKPAKKPDAKVPFYTNYNWTPAPSLNGVDQGAAILAKLAAHPHAQAYPAAPPPVAPPPVAGNPWAAQPPPPPPPQPWVGKPIQQGHWWDGAKWVALPPGVTG